MHSRLFSRSWHGALALAVASLVSALPLPAAQAPRHSAVDPVPRPDKGWQDRQQAFNKKVLEVGDKAQVIFIGDSITQGWEGEGREVWSRYYTKRNAINLGIGGDRTQHVLWRLANGNLTGLKPKAAVVMIGTNNSNGEDNTPGQIVDGVTAIVESLRTRLPDTKIILCAIFPRGENYNPQRGKLLQINQVLRRLADDKHVFWADFGHEFVTSDGLIPRDLMPDFLHLTPKAYGLWAAAIEPRLAGILGDSATPATTAGVLTGKWSWTIDGPDGKPITSPMELKQDGNKVTGRLARDATRWLQIEKGTVNGNSFSWTVRRDRPDGTTMTYEMTGKVEGTEIRGQATTKMDGNDVNVPWTARRE